MKSFTTTLMKYNLKQSLEVLQNTPFVLKSLFNGLFDEWVMNNEGPETFSPYDVVGHLIQGEKEDWTKRIKMLLDHGSSKTFATFDRFAMYEESKGKSMMQLLDEFNALRKMNLDWFSSLQLREEDLDKKGMHPELGEVTLRQLLSTWVVHDLTHISQISRVMAKQYKEEIGPWVDYIRIMNS